MKQNEKSDKQEHPTKYPIELIVNEQAIRTGEITLRYTDAFSITRFTSTKFNYWTFRFGDDDRPADDRQVAQKSILDVLDLSS